MTLPVLSDPHWLFVLAGYGLVLLALAFLLAGSLSRLLRARARLALMQRPGREDTHTPPQEKD